MPGLWNSIYLQRTKTSPRAIVNSAITETRAAVIDIAIAVAEMELRHPDVLDSKPAGDAIRRMIANLRRFRDHAE